MWKITENLYLAQLPMIIGPTANQEFNKNKIKRVLTLTNEEIPEKERLQNVDYKFIPLFDMPNEPILSNGTLEEAISYITESVEKEENIVVHCLAAVSRSVTICAAFLMYINSWPVEKALKMIESVRKSIGPNPGFLAQLKIWERCGMSFSAEKYKDLYISVPGQPDVDSKTIWRQPIVNGRTKVHFKCRQCRKTMFDSDNIVHPQLAESCQKYLIEPMEWLNITAASCTINHSCGAKLGTFIAAGSKCNGCNKFVKRWIFIDRSKVDKVEPTI
uniref:protein-tyrosine-phosphatase n=2 Tax=Caenorhabditis tropicalis TaxID=1561998 RepID=A0A1I7TD78_9PELO